MSKARARKVADAVRAIREFHAKGAAIPRPETPKEGYGMKVVEQAGQKVGLTPEVARQARQFADSVIGYTAEEVRELCALIKRVQPEQADGLAVFGRTHVIRLLSVRPRSTRAKLQRTAVVNGWSTARLEAEIARRFGTRRDGGRDRRVPPDAEGLLAQLEGMCEGWRRWRIAVTPGESDEGPGHAVLDDLPKGIREQVAAVGDALLKLQTSVTKALAEDRPGRAARHALLPEGQTR